MPDYGINKKSISKEVRYLGRDFTSIRQNLIEFAKSYFPNTYNDFNEASPGMMFIEMAAYVGDVMNYYVDNQFRESLLHAAEEKKNIYKIAQSLGYKPKVSHPSTAICEFTIEVPSTTTDDTNYRPDLDYAPILDGNSLFGASNGSEFRLMDDVNFAVSSSLDRMDVAISKFSDNAPTHYTLTKRGRVESGKRYSETFTFGSAEKFNTAVLSNSKVVEIISITDSDGNKWYEVPFLAQDTVFESIANTSDNDPELASSSNDTPYLLKLIKSSRRFTKYVRSDGKTELRFGAGVSTNPDEEIIPNPDRVGSSLASGISKLDTAFDPANFLNTRTYGLAPSNTTLTIKYTVGGGIQDNVPANDIKNLNDVTYDIDDSALVTATVQETKDSVAVNNPDPAGGGRSGESLIEIKNNALAYFQAQSRAVTKEDYMIRAISLPQRFGNIAKVYIVQDEQLNQAEEQVQEPEVSVQDAPPLEEQIENINPLVQEAADLKSTRAEAKVQTPAKVRETIAKARMTSPKKANETLRGASAANPLGRRVSPGLRKPIKTGGRGGGY